MIPFKLTKPQFSQKFRSILHGYSLVLINEFRQVVKFPKEKATGATLEVGLIGEQPLFINVCLVFQSDVLKIGERGQEIKPFDANFSKKANFAPEYYEWDFGGLNLIADELRVWISECWWKAGGWDYPIPVELIIHDEIDVLGNTEIIQLTERWK